MAKANKYTYISLFSSAGVGCYGFKMNDFDCVATNELLKERLDVQVYNNKCKYESGYILGDITKPEIKDKLYNEINFWKKTESLEKVDVVIATPPCQGMSTVNLKKSDETKRNSLVLEAIEMVKNIQPNIFVFENVQNFLDTYCIDKNNVAMKISEAIQRNLSLEYNIYSRVINFKNYGVPSSRPRTLVIGTLKQLHNISPLNIFPISSPIMTLRETIGDLPELDFGEICENDIYHHFRAYDLYMREWISCLNEGDTAYNNPDNLKPYTIKDGLKTLISGGSMGNKYRRMFWDQPAPCITTRNDQLASQNTIHPSQDRVLSIRELMRVMSIPDNFKWTLHENINEASLDEKRKFLKKHELKIRRAIGEAVPTNIIYQIASNIKTMLDFEKYLLNKHNNIDMQDNFYIQSYIFEHSIENANETGAFYTPQNVVFESLRHINLVGKNNIKILEPSVGMGAYLPQLIALIGESNNVEIDLVDINGDTLNRLQEIINLINYNHNQIKFNFINSDFLLCENLREYYDLIVANPPYIKLKGNEIEKYRVKTEDKSLCNTFGFFMDKMANMSDEIVVIIPKYFLMTPEFNNLRVKYENIGIISIVDYGACFFKEVFIEIISIHFKSGYRKDLIVKDLRENKITTHVQNYIQHDKMWIIYRNEWFDEYIKTLKLDVFDYFRDRQLRKDDMQPSGKIRVLKSKNLNDVGDIVNIDKYDCFIDDIDVYNVKKYLNTEQIIMTNFTYNTRAAYLPKDTIVNGSLAILTLKDNNDKELVDLSLYSSDSFRRYYAIVKNNSKFTINIDKNSIYYIGVRKNDDK